MSEIDRGDSVGQEDEPVDTIAQGGRTARLLRNTDGRLVSHGETEVTDDVMYALIDAGRLKWILDPNLHVAEPQKDLRLDRLPNTTTERGQGAP